ncbi:hypothetical protein ONZ43_g234 [Nemania bipapillata]|uniref:Uncharacterized protein n=1 Tax=Nemania bipapillata TaxID=110536 RepID=A0ACC2J906_9PEZI|nr:hypothetical protein ONZ43_g234 [Nemania bipapillata]
MAPSKPQPKPQPEEILDAALVTLEPLSALNEFRARLGLPPSRNLISSPAYFQGTQEETSPANQGDASPSRNVNAKIPDEENCRLWITGLPPKCTVKQLLVCITGFGPIFSCNVIQPELPENDVWSAAAASLTFFSAPAANLFFQRYTTKPFIVNECVTMVERHQVPAKSVDVDGQSRVLRIIGDASIVYPDNLKRIVKEEWGVAYEMGSDSEITGFTPAIQGRWNEVVWAFGSFHGQAHTVFDNVNEIFAGRARAMYLADPCV